jgi:hypothetical protein
VDASDLSVGTDRVLFLLPAGDCFRLTHGNRSVVPVVGKIVDIGEIQGEPNA